MARLLGPETVEPGRGLSAAYICGAGAGGGVAGHAGLSAANFGADLVADPGGPGENGTLPVPDRAEDDTAGRIFYYALARFGGGRKNGCGADGPGDRLGAGGPGRAFKLDEDSVLEYLDGLEEACEVGFASMTRR